MLRYLERGLLVIAALALIKFGMAYADNWNSEETVASFKQQRMLIANNETQLNVTPKVDNPSAEPAATPQAKSAKEPVTRSSSELDANLPDMTLWSPQRKSAFERAGKGQPILIAAIEIPSVGVHAPIYHGTDHPQLDRGAGWILGTAGLDSSRGNIGIAAHRDGFFRGLKDITVGDEIELATLTEDRRYRVQSLTIVKPEDVHVLASSEAAELTLVTCYPFYFVGKAPKRFIVKAELIERTPLSSN